MARKTKSKTRTITPAPAAPPTPQDIFTVALRQWLRAGILLVAQAVAARTSAPIRK